MRLYCSFAARPGKDRLKNHPKTAMLRGFGGGQNCRVPILRVLEEGGAKNENRENRRKNFYEGLAEHKIYARKCKECGAIEYPPRYACNTCGYHETEWVELSGKGSCTALFYRQP